jgi:hypothetical protein
MYRRQSRHPGFAPHAARYAGRERSLDLAALPKETVAHLFDCLSGKTTPSPLGSIVSEPAGGAKLRLKVAAGAAIALLFSSVATCVGGSAPTIASAIGLVVLAAVAGGALIDALRVAKMHPYGVAPGVYLLPFDVVEVSSKRVRVVPLATARDVRVVAKTGAARIEVVCTDGASLFFAAVDVTHAEGAHAAILEAIARVESLGDSRDNAVLAPLDPFVEFRTGAWPAPVTAPSRTPVQLGRAAVAIAALASGFLGAVAFHYAERTNDDARFATAFSRGSVAGYRAYLASGGGRYSAEVVATLIPRLELRRALLDAPRLADVESLETFIAKYPDSIYAEVARNELATKVPGVNVTAP